MMRKAQRLKKVLKDLKITVSFESHYLCYKKKEKITTNLHGSPISSSS